MEKRPHYFINAGEKDTLNLMNDMKDIMKQNDQEHDGDNVETPAPSTIEERYKEFLYFMARYESINAEHKATEYFRTTLREHDMDKSATEQSHRQSELQKKQADRERAVRVAKRWDQVMYHYSIPRQAVVDFPKGLDMRYGVPLRAKYFGKGESNKLINSWDKLLYALDKAKPYLAPIPDTDNTVPFSNSLTKPTDNIESVQEIMASYDPTL